MLFLVLKNGIDNLSQSQHVKTNFSPYISGHSTVHQVVYFCVKSISGSPLSDLLFIYTRKLVKCPGERELRIFKLLSKYIKDPLLATKFVDILVPFITKRAKNCGKNLS